MKARDEYFQTHYDVYAKGAGIYCYFIEKGFQLLRPKGSLAFIIPETFLRINDARPLRKFLLTKQIEEVVKFCDLTDLKIANTCPCFLRVSNNKAIKKFLVSNVDKVDIPDLAGYINARKYPINQNTLTDGGWMLGDKRKVNLLKKLQSVGTPLEEYLMGAVYYGIKTGLDKAFVIDDQIREKLIEEDPKSEELIQPFVASKDVKRYQPPGMGKYIIFIRQGWTRIQSGNAKNTWNWLQKNYPAIARHLEPFAEPVKKKIGKQDFWWETRCEYISEFEKPKIICLHVRSKPTFIFDSQGSFFSDSDTFIIPQKNLLLLGILNSKLGWFLVSNFCVRIRGGCQHILRDLGKIPIYTIDFDNPEDKARHDRMVTLVTEMLELHKHLSQAKTDQEKRIITQEIKSTDRQIDSLVYGLYGLATEEIAVVEESISK